MWVDLYIPKCMTKNLVKFIYEFDDTKFKNNKSGELYFDTLGTFHEQMEYVVSFYSLVVLKCLQMFLYVMMIILLMIPIVMLISILHVTWILFLHNLTQIYHIINIILMMH
jgi:hypothetical protein